MAATAMMDSANTGIGALPMPPEEDMMPQTGIGSAAGSAIQSLAAKGRGSDTLIAHLTPGEIVVPKDVLKQNPQVKEMIFAELRLMGVEDPEQYVVGSEANSINPETGMPEFLIKTIRKAVSNVGKAVKSTVKTVSKVIKKVAPVVLPIALAMTPLGAVYGAALGSGIGTLIQGGSLKDAIKAGAISGALGGITAGIGSKMGGGTFTGGVKDAFSNAGARFSQFGQGLSGNQAFFSNFQAPGAGTSTSNVAAETAADATTMGDNPTTIEGVKAQATDVTGTSTAVPDYSPVGKVPAGPDVAAINDPYFQDASGVFDETGRNAVGYRYEGISGTPDGTGYDYRFGGTGGQPTSTANLSATAPSSTGAAEQALATMEASYNPQVAQFETDTFLRSQSQPTFFERAQTSAGNFYDDYISPSRGAPGSDAYNAEYDRVLELTGDKTAAFNAAEASVPGLTKYLPAAGVVAGGLALTDAAGITDVYDSILGVPEEEPIDEGFEGKRYEDMTEEEKEAFRIQGLDPNRYQGRDSYVVGYQSNNPYYGMGNFYQPRNNVGGGFFGMGQGIRRAAQGGEMTSFPRRMGHITGPGTGTSDDVPAMLSDGEFVMTAQAVRGAGNGSRSDGVGSV